jgi:hypothetical protein
MITKNKICIGVIPFIFIAVNLAYLSVIFPLYSGPPGYDQDPAYAYLFNGLLLLDGQAPWHVDHPGTPLQILCAGVIFVAHFFINLSTSIENLDLIDSVITNPEPYLFAISCFLLLMNAGAIYYLGYRISKVSSRFWLAIFCQLSGLAFSILSPRAAYVAPESLLIFTSFCLIGLLVPFIFNTSSVQTLSSDSSTKWLGIFCGVGLAVKVTFIPMLGLLLLLPSLKKILKVSAIAVVTLLIFLIPVYTNLGRMFGWLWNVASHSGIHGSGQSILIDWAQLLQNIKSVLSWFAPLYATVFLLFLYLLITFVRRPSNKSIRVPIVLIVVIIAQSLLVLKHPGAHYLIPVLPLAFIGFAWLLIQLELITVDKEKNIKNIIRYMCICVATLFALYGVLPTLKQILVMKQQRIEQNNALSSINNEIQKTPDALVICAFRCTTFQYAVSMALLYAPGLASRPVVISILRNFYEYNFLVKEMIAPGIGSFKLDELPEQLTKHTKVFLITPKIYPDLDVFKLEKVISAGILTLYEITGLATSGSIKQSRDQTN